jgi:hypothetical protein
VVWPVRVAKFPAFSPAEAPSGCVAASLSRSAPSPTRPKNVSLGDAAQSLRQTSDTTRESLGNLNREFEPLAISLRNTSDRAGVTIQQTNDLVTALERSTDSDSPLFYQLTRAANNLGEVGATELAPRVPSEPGDQRRSPRPMASAAI